MSNNSWSQSSGRAGFKTGSDPLQAWPSAFPWEIPLRTSEHREDFPSTTTLCLRIVQTTLIQLYILPTLPSRCNFKQSLFYKVQNQRPFGSSCYWASRLFEVCHNKILLKTMFKFSILNWHQYSTPRDLVYERKFTEQSKQNLFNINEKTLNITNVCKIEFLEVVLAVSPFVWNCHHLEGGVYKEALPFTQRFVSLHVFNYVIFWK